MIKLICSNCYNVFEARRKSAKYCSAGCRQRSHRVRNGQQNKAFAHLVEPKNERHVCKHCGNGFWGKGKGRTPKFCCNSCRVSANRFKWSASYRFVKYMNGSALGWTDYDCWMHVQQKGTGHIEQWANKAGWEYSHTIRAYWKRSEKLWNDHVA